LIKYSLKILDKLGWIPASAGMTIPASVVLEKETICGLQTPPSAPFDTNPIGFLVPRLLKVPASAGDVESSQLILAPNSFQRIIDLTASCGQPDFINTYNI